FRDEDITAALKNTDDNASAFLELKTMDLTSISIDDLKPHIKRTTAGLVRRSALVDPGVRLYRATKLGGENWPTDVSRLTYPEPALCLRDQRCNRAGRPLFYCSIGPNSTFFEIGAEVDDLVVLSRW